MKKLLVFCIGLALAGCTKNDAVYQGKSAGSWVRALNNPETRPEATHALEELGPAAIPALIDGLRNEDAPVREGSAEALRKNGKEAVPALSKALEHPNDAVRRQAAFILGEIGPAAGSAVLALIEALKDPNLSVRVYSARAIWKVDRQDKTAVTALTEILKDPAATLDIRRVALDTLTDIGPEAKPALPDITAALKDENGPVRLAAAKAIWKVDRQSKTATETLLAILQAPDAPLEQRRQAIDALAEIGPEARTASPALTKLLDDPSAYVRIKAARALWQIDKQALPILDTLRKSLKYQKTDDPDNATVRSWAAYLLGEIGPEATAAFAELVPALQDKDDNVRKQTAFTLNKIVGPNDKQLAEPLSTAALKDKHPYVRFNAARALARVDPSRNKVVVGVLLEGLKDPGPDVRRLAVDALGEMRPEAKAALPQLNAALQDKSPQVRRAAADTLAKLGPEAKGSVAALTEALKDADPEVRVRAANALWLVDNQSMAALPVLVRALNDPSDAVRAWAAYTLAEIGPLALAAVPDLTKNLHAKSDRVRKQAAYALGKIGPQARTAVPVLITLARTDPQKDIREQAAAAAHKIDPQQARSAGIQ